MISIGSQSGELSGSVEADLAAESMAGTAADRNGSGGGPEQQPTPRADRVLEIPVRVIVTGSDTLDGTEEELLRDVRWALEHGPPVP